MTILTANICNALLAILLFALPAFGQSQSRPRRTTTEPAARETARDREQRRLDEEAVRKMPDAGYDLAFVVANQVSVYEEPTYSSKVLLVAKRGEVLALIEREPTGNFFKIIHVKSATEGWVRENGVVLKLTLKRENAPRLEEEYLGSNKDPELSITNLETATDLNLRINGERYVVKAATTRTFNLKPGRYEYYGWSPGVSPAIGSHDLQVGIRYSWTFKIVRR